MNEKLSLVFFTVLTQTGIGLVLAAQLFGADGRLVVVVLISAMVMSALGLMVAFLHLGQPLTAYRAIRNIRSSWLSRECLALGAFLVLGAVRLYLELSGGPGGLAVALGWLMVLFGCLCLFSMSSSYGKTGIPAWGMLHTHVAFYSAAVSLGSILFAVVAGQVAPHTAANIAVALLSACGVIVQIAGFIAYSLRLGANGAAAYASVQLLSKMALLLVTGHIFIMLGGVVFPFLAYASAFSNVGAWLCVSLLLLAVGQFIARYVYYAAGVHTMTEGWADIGSRPRSRR